MHGENNDTVEFEQDMYSGCIGILEVAFEHAAKEDEQEDNGSCAPPMAKNEKCTNSDNNG